MIHRLLFALGVALLLAAASPRAFAAQAPEIEQWRDPSGALVLVVSRPGFERVSFVISIEYGAAHDSARRSWLAHATARMLLRGTEGANRVAFEDRLAALGARLEAEVTPTATLIRGEVLAVELTPCLELVNEALTRPRFDPDELAQLKRELDDERQVELSNDESLAYRSLRGVLYEGHPLGQPLDGTADTVARLTPETLRAFHHGRLGADRLTIALGGHLDARTLRGELERIFTALPPHAPAPPPLGALGDGRRGRVLLIDKPQRTQNHLLVAQRLPAFSHPDHLALQVVAIALGEGARSRLYRALRSERAWTYGVRSDLDWSASSSTLVSWAFTSPDRVLDVVTLALDELGRLGEGDLTAAEFEWARRWLMHWLERRFDSAEVLVDWLIRAHLAGLSVEDVLALRGRVEALTLAEARDAARRHLPTGTLVVVVVCTARYYQKMMQEIEGVDEVRVRAFDDD